MIKLPEQFESIRKRFQMEGMAVYGKRLAASRWEGDYARKLVSHGFAGGRTTLTICYHPVTDVRVVVHGDDFTLAGTEVKLRKDTIENSRFLRHALLP